VADTLDYNAKCQTTVTAYVMTFEELCILRRSYHEFDRNVTKTEKNLISAENGIALDYIVKEPIELR
jgi:hypothetical protein